MTPSSNKLPCPCGENAPRRLLATLGPRHRIEECVSCGLHALCRERPETERDEYDEIDFETYRISLESFRKASFRRLLGELASLSPGKKLLDVGCSFGWLLEEALIAGWDPAGIDPSPRAVRRASARGLKAKEGAFPAGIGEGEKFDAITFMDVLEHMEDPGIVLRETRRRLAPRGLVAIKVPSAEGPLYKMSLAAAKIPLGIFKRPAERLYQIHFPFPHLYYYSARTLTALLQKQGFEVLRVYEEEILDGRDVFKRLSFASAGRYQKLKLVPAAILLKAFVPLLKISPRKDILTILARPDNIEPSSDFSKSPS